VLDALLSSQEVWAGGVVGGLLEKPLKFRLSYGGEKKGGVVRSMQRGGSGDRLQCPKGV